jgi:Lantibiotic dehydratase, N terminus
MTGTGDRDAGPALDQLPGSGRDPLVPLPGGQWMLWEDSLLRGAGFPVDGLSRLADPELAAAADRHAAGETSAAEFDRLWQARTAVLQQAVLNIAGSERFRLAVAWQNSEVLETAIEPLLRWAAEGKSRDRKYRSKERLVASYWQRYCAKNETIGFFGPMAWGKVGDRSGLVSIRHGPELVDRADVFLENWPIDALAHVLDERPGLHPWLCPRRSPYLQLGRGHVVLPHGELIPLDPLTAAALKRADGTTRAHDIASDLTAADPEINIDQVYAVLENLRQRRWIVWALEVPVSIRPEKALRGILERIGDPMAREAALSQLAPFERTRTLLQVSWDDPVLVKRLHEDLERAFAAATGHTGTRHHGRTYGGRTLTHLECARGVKVELGRDFLDALAPMSMMLDSIRWLCWRIRVEFDPEVRHAYRLIVSQGDRQPNIGVLWMKCMPLLRGKLGAIVDNALQEFYEQWESLLGLDDTINAKRIQVRLDDVREVVREKFYAPSAGWREAHWCSPDIMIAAVSENDIQQGRFQLVLGELHAAMNSIDYSVATFYHPDDSSLFASLDASCPAPRVLIALPKDNLSRLSPRTHPALIRDADYHLALLPHTPVPGAGRVRFGGDVPVLEEGDALIAVLGPDDHVDVMDLFAEPLKDILLQKLDLFPFDHHRPRVAIDRLVVTRECWAFTAAELPFAQKPDELSRYVAVQRWRRDHGLPRYVFVKSPLEMKPFFIDFTGPVYIEILATAARRLSRETGESAMRLKFTEMFPAPDEAWLTDSAGNRYTSEFRFVAVDPARTRFSARTQR